VISAVGGAWVGGCGVAVAAGDALAVIVGGADGACDGSLMPTQPTATSEIIAPITKPVRTPVLPRNALDERGCLLRLLKTLPSVVGLDEGR
jgi:hypothetical protein